MWLRDIHKNAINIPSCNVNYNTRGDYVPSLLTVVFGINSGRNGRNLQNLSVIGM